MKLVSWNVNGLRAVHGRNDLDWAFNGDVDVIGLQETKIQADHITDAMRSPKGYARSWWSIHETKKGYSGTAIFVKDGLAAEPFAFRIGGAEHPEYDAEGRIVAVLLGQGLDAFVLVNVYFPNGGSSDERLAFKHAWHDAFLDAVNALSKTHKVVVCGDFNIAHKDLDLALPERWAGKFSGALPVERQWFDRLLACGYVDSFRAIKGDLPRQFTFWETRVDARTVNQGWRIDYFVVPNALEERVLDAWISPQIHGSDHCPVGIEFDIAGAPAVWDVAASDDDTAVSEDEEAVEEDDDDDAPRWRR
jgi:exodeoxyribonuclease-3